MLSFYYVLWCITWIINFRNAETKEILPKAILITSTHEAFCLKIITMMMLQNFLQFLKNVLLKNDKEKTVTYKATHLILYYFGRKNNCHCSKIIKKYKHTLYHLLRIFQDNFKCCIISHHITVPQYLVIFLVIIVQHIFWDMNIYYFKL